MNSKKIFLVCFAGLFMAAFTYLWFSKDIKKSDKPIAEDGKFVPNDWFFAQRAFPTGQINEAAYREGMQQVKALKQVAAIEQHTQWQAAGPTNIGGRISDLELSPTNFDTIYAGAASGGIFRSIDRGQSWQPVFDDALSLSIGDIALAPSNSNILYVGTGEVNAGGGSQTYSGFGVYKSIDAGENWTHAGLENTHYISRIVVDPENPNRLFAGAMGKLFAENSERGVYRSEDGGATWQQSLFVSDSTGCIDLVMHPNNPDTIYAAMWERIREPHRRSYGGSTCGIYRTVDGGDNWQELTNGIPSNIDNIGRIGIAISQSNPSILYAIYADKIGYFDGVYKSENNGDTWNRTNDGALSNLYVSYGWWFGNIRVDPTNPNTVFALGLEIYKTTNGGQSWGYSSGGIHVDQHDLYIHPQNPNYVVAGNDGGIYISNNGGSSYQKSPNLPITQFYTNEIDFQEPQRLYGGTQDNGTNRTLTGNLDDWHSIYGGDGFYVKVDPSDNNFVYAEYQWGGLGRSTNGGLSFGSATSGISGRNNWSSPLELHPSTPSTLYFGTHRVFKSTNRAVSWTPISDDLTDGPSTGNLAFGTLTTIAAAATDIEAAEVLYAGSDDGNVWVTQNGGSSWQHISQSLPKRWVTRVMVDPADALTAYVTFSGYRWDEYLPHIFRTTDAGNNWEDISSNLPELPLNDVIIDPNLDSTLYVASDGGVFFTQNLGITWQAMGNNFPNVPVTDLTLHNPTRTLAAATYGRSMFTYDLNLLTNIESATSEVLPQAFSLAQNYPNPFNGETVIPFKLEARGQVFAAVYNIRGQKVKTLTNQYYPAGSHKLHWDGRNDSGATVASGTYIYRLKHNNRVQSKRMILAK